MPKSATPRAANDTGKTRGDTVNADQLEQLIKQRLHFTPRSPNCPGELCWCGICHCDKCQIARAAQFLAAVDTERGPTGSGGGA